MNEKVLVKFTNVSFYHGGGKRPLRLRRNQNHTQWIKKEWLERVGEEYVINSLPYLTKGEKYPSSTTKLIKITKTNYEKQGFSYFLSY